MKLQLTRPTGPGNIISGYGDDHVLVNGERHSASLVVTAETVLPWAAGRFEALEPAHFEALAALAPEIVLLGTGPRLRFPPAALTVPLVQAGIGLEVMDLRAACRTYNVLRAEDRRVAAALLFE
ncbi:MAG: Mth938-like domain-containing protein [Burkholderiales bacterium]|nr:Mth938-like domain-containing protein [Burkholderiales bacterium]